jgi:hypothetical protein
MQSTQNHEDLIVANTELTKGGCWEWTGRITPQGYGTISLAGKSHRAHRLSYEALVGPIPDGLGLDHLCRNRPCVNPDHLEPVTQSVNTKRGFGIGTKHSMVTHCPKGHEYDEFNTYERPDGGRGCHKCRADYFRRPEVKARAAERWKRKKAAQTANDPAHALILEGDDK